MAFRFGGGGRSRRRPMKHRLVLIALAAAVFGWGFAALVRHSDTTIRPEAARSACQDWSGNGCVRMAER